VFKIAITTTSFGKYDEKSLELLKNKGYEVIFNPYNRTLKGDEIIEICKNAVGIIAGTEQLDADILENLTTPISPQSSVKDSLSYLKVISRCGTGVDNIDIIAAERFGIKVLNTPDAPILAVTELTIGLMLNLLRKINQADSAIRNGKWEKPMGNLLTGKKVGIIGFGRIGRKVAELLVSFGCEIRYYDIKNVKQILGIKKVELYELLKTSDIVSIHVSSKEQIIGETEIRFMKKGAWLVNVARGGVIDENALYLALKEGHLAGAALDVFEQEPYTFPLPELNNVILTPHIGSYALEARIQMERQAVENLLKGLEGVQ
jgi:D-3-phosphoglycerate dehydrogenase